MAWQIAIMLLSSLLETQSAIFLPKPSGPHPVLLRTTKWTDDTRLDPFAPTPEARSVMISLFAPLTSRSTCSPVDYMPPATAGVEDEQYSIYGTPNGTFELFKLPVCEPSSPTASLTCLDRVPLVVFSPAILTSRLLYNALAMSVASFGFIVVSIDHPYEYPDGTFIYAANINQSDVSQIESALATRVQDVTFVLNQLGRKSVMRALFPGAPSGLDVRKVAMFGHSLGGATAAAAILADSRVIGGANLDGTLYGPVVDQGFNAPFLLFGHQGKNQSTDSSWATIWPHLVGWKLELALNASAHYTFSDLPLLAKELGIPVNEDSGIAPLLGTLDGLRALDVISTYVTAFLKYVFTRVDDKLLQGPDPAYPEVQFIAKDESTH